MPKKMDHAGLLQSYMTLGQISEGIRLHKEDAALYDAENGSGLEEELESADAAVCRAQNILQRVLSVVS